MRYLFLLNIILLITGCNFVQAVDFTITEVIQVGENYNVDLVSPALWSPDGTKLGYFSGNQFMYADTLGNSYPVTELDLPPHRFRWVSNNEIIMYQCSNVF